MSPQARVAELATPSGPPDSSSRPAARSSVDYRGAVVIGASIVILVFALVVFVVRAIFSDRD
jgi:hypothetical protein